VGAYADVERVIASKTLRAGQGKGRNRRFSQRRGPLVVYGDDTPKLAFAFRNIPGVDLVHIDRLNLLQLAPGGHLGRFCVWTEGAFKHLNRLFGSTTEKAELKTGYLLPRAPIANADIARLINSTEIQAVLRPALRGSHRLSRQKKNPLVNFKALVKLNPYAKTVREQEVAAAAARAAKKTGAKAAKKAGTRNDKAARARSTAQYKAMTSEEFKRPTEFLA
jgi:large subunit ribosomal protein L4e